MFFSHGILQIRQHLNETKVFLSLTNEVSRACVEMELYEKGFRELKWENKLM